nr:hypothetical protein CFP56_04356 [Quercus suber]
MGLHNNTSHLLATEPTVSAVRPNQANLNTMGVYVSGDNAGHEPTPPDTARIVIVGIVTFQDGRLQGVGGCSPVRCRDVRMRTDDRWRCLPCVPSWTELDQREAEIKRGVPPGGGRGPTIVMAISYDRHVNDLTFLALALGPQSGSAVVGPDGPRTAQPVGRLFSAM